MQIDFGACTACFDGSARFLEIAVRPHSADPNNPPYATLSPRQPVSATPYAIRSLNASQLEGQPATGFIQNTTSQQVMTNFNISGDGTAGGTLNANIVNAGTQYNIVSPAGAGSVRIMGISGTGDTNTFVGRSAAAQNPSGSFNTLVGNGAGQATTSGGNNSFFGSGSGNVNQSGSDNAFFGRNAGFANTASDNSFFGSFAGAANGSGFRNSFFGKDSGRNNTGSFNSFFGAVAGASNTDGVGNPFFGFAAGTSNTDGGNNSFFGYSAGNANTTVSGNTFIGASAGEQNGMGDTNSTANFNTFIGAAAGSSNQTGSDNTFVGTSAGIGNQSGNRNTLVGHGANLGLTNLVNAAAIGEKAFVEQNNSLVLGSINGKNSATADTAVGIGTTAPSFRLHIIDPSNAGLRVQTNLVNGTVASFGGNGDFQVDAPGIAGGRFIVTQFGFVGIGAAIPTDKLQVAGDIRIGTSGTNGCLKNFNGGTLVGTCSSDARFKRDITPFASLLPRLVQLRPVYFYWRAGEYPDRHFGQAQEAGLIAQEVERVMPELISTDEQGYKAVNYSKLPLLTIQAIKELKAENDTLKQSLNQQQAQINVLEKTRLRNECRRKLLQGKTSIVC